MDDAVRILEPPKVEPVHLDVKSVDPGEMAKLMGAFQRNDRVMILVDIINCRTQERARLSAEAFMTSIDFGIGELPYTRDAFGYRQLGQVRPAQANFTIKGGFTNAIRVSR